MHALDAKSDRVKESEQKAEESIGERVKLTRQEFDENKDSVADFNKRLVRLDKTINKRLFRQYFGFQSLSNMQEELYKTRNKQMNKIQTDLNENNLEKLRNDIKNMSKDDNEIKKAYEIADVVVEILGFNEKNQEGQGTKILTPQKMLSRLPISLAMLKAGNNSEKLKNEIRQLKKTKQNNL